MIINFTDCHSQDQLTLDVDNDLYFNRDFYYSSGISVAYSSNKSKQEKRFMDHLKLVQYIYTPSSRYETDPRKYDYPYTGYLFLEASRQKKLSDYSSLSLGGNIGITGDASLAKGMQNLYHDIVLNLPNLEWKSQMPQEIQVNLIFNYFRGFNLYDKISLSTKFYSRLGTYQLMAGINVGLLIGDLSWHSFSDNIIYKSQNNFSFYIGTSQEYYLHDYKLEGSLFNDNAPLTMTSNKYRNVMEIGLLKKFNRLQVLSTFNSMSKDTEIQRTLRHPFLKISVSYILN
mgnify:FL=1|tara:strand:+ start:46 stop:903 length:858 start_codon:yes stop_codon:yes gene_type:complete